LDEELSSGQQQPSPQSLPAVAWAKPAQPSSRLLYARPPLRSSTRVKLLEIAKPSDVCTRGLFAVYSGANSIASALHLLIGCDPDGNQSHSKPELSATASKPDISTLLRIGHFYFALTREESFTSLLARPPSRSRCRTAGITGPDLCTR
jgi:hypothetical protein